MPGCGYEIVKRIHFGSLFDNYIHYGITKEEFDPEKVKYYRDALDKWESASYIRKPIGFWGSHEDEDPKKCLTWKEWCESADFHVDSLDRWMTFRVKKNARIIRIEKEEDLKPFLIRENLRFSGLIGSYLNQDLVRNIADGMELYHGYGGCNYEELHFCLCNAWDVDSICVWNPDVLEVVE